MKDLDPYKEHEPHEISPYALKECAETFDIPLNMLRKLMEEGLVPREWRRANVIATFKNEISKMHSQMSTVCKTLRNHQKTSLWLLAKYKLPKREAAGVQRKEVK